MRRCVETMALEQHHQDDKAEVCMVCLVLGRRKYKYVYIRKETKISDGAAKARVRNVKEKNKHTDGAAKARVGKRVACNRMG